MAVGHGALYLHPSSDGIALGVRVGILAGRATKHFMESSALLGESMVVLARACDGKLVLELLGHARAELHSARDYAARARGALGCLAKFVDLHPDLGYEQHLRSRGFQSADLLAEYERQLARFGQALAAAEECWPAARGAAETGQFDFFLGDSSSGLYAAMRLACEGSIELLQFQHRAEETRCCLLSFKTGAPRVGMWN